MKKIIILSMGICSLLFIALSCDDGKAKIELKKIVLELNRNCPMEYDLATCIGATIEDGNLVVNYVYDEDAVNFSAMKQNMELAKKYNGSFFFGQNKEMSNLIVRSGYGFTANYKGSKTQETTSFHLSNDEIKQVLENPESNNDILDWQILMTNLSLPMQVDEYTELVSVDCKNDVVSYNYVIDDERVSMSQMVEIQDEIKDELRQELAYEWTSPKSTSKQFLTLICRTNKSLRYSYRGKTTGKELAVEFSNGELRNISHDVIEEE